MDDKNLTTVAILPTGLEGHAHHDTPTMHRGP